MVKNFPKPNIFISKCLGFARCRWNGVTLFNTVVEALKPKVTIITNCPEFEIGLGAPRKPIRIVKKEDKLHLIQHETELDLSEKMIRYTDNLFTSFADKELDGFILKNRSPTCGISDVRIYPSIKKSAPLRSKAQGFFGKKVYEYFPNLAIEDEGRLNNTKIRENFLTKIFTLANYRNVKRKQEISELIDFHTCNKILLRTYNQKQLRMMGRIVASYKKKNISEILDQYEIHLKQALLKSPRVTSTIDALLHAFGHFSKVLKHEEKAFFLDNLEQYRREQIPLSLLQMLLKSWILRFDEKYLKKQTFFAPFPEELTKIK